MGELIKLPTAKGTEELHQIFVSITPAYHGKDTLELRLVVQTDREQYTKSEIRDRHIFKSHFDLIFDQAKEELRRFIQGG